MERKRLFVDLDGTLARFHDEANYLERMFEEGFFRDLKPFENMISGINTFIQEHPDVEVYTITACIDSPHCIHDKNVWLDTHQINIPPDHRIYTEMGKPKADYIPGPVTKNDYLLDDYNRTLNQFLFDGGSAIKCHNNINQLGLGAHGGSPGNLWIGPMVHVNDTPEMIAAELAQHMELEYDLRKVINSYKNILLISEDSPYIKGWGGIEPQGDNYVVKEPLNGRFGHIFSNPLNAIRHLDGNPDFFEYKAKTHNRKIVHAPAFQLKAITANLYGNADFRSFLRADHTQFAEDVSNAIEQSKHAMVGQVQSLYYGGAEDVTIFWDTHAMQQAIQTANAENRPVSIVWFIPPSHQKRESSFDNMLSNAMGRAEAQTNTQLHEPEPSVRGGKGNVHTCKTT